MRRIQYTIGRVAALPILLLVAGCGSGPTSTSGPELYAHYCATCHQIDGSGIEGAFPPLVDMPWVTGDKGRLIRLALRGMRGPLTVDGKVYNNTMTPHAFLSDQQLAAVLTFVRTEMGGTADSVSADEVARVRAVDGVGPMWNPDEIEARMGIPPAAAN